MMRRTFLKVGSAGLASVLLHEDDSLRVGSKSLIETQINFTSDGLALRPQSYVRLLSQLVDKKEFDADEYCLGDVIQRFEDKVARALGKEKAIYMPTGTLANHIALRLHCAGRRKTLVQQQSHVYRDCGDALPHLSGIQLVPLGENKVAFTMADVEKAVRDTAAEKVQTGIEAISIETPVRRQHLRRFDFETIETISQFAQGKGIGMHLDGARIFGEAAISGIDVKDFAALFDTVYISLYKYFNSIAGAILAGPTELIEGLHHERRMFGGGLRAAWENVVVADSFLDNFEARFLTAQQNGNSVMRKLSENGNFRVEQFEDGTNVYKLFPVKVAPDIFQKRMTGAGIGFPAPCENEGCFVIKLNESLAAIDVDELADLFLKNS